MIQTSPIKQFRWLGLIVISALLILIFRLPAIAQTPRHYTELEFPPYRKFLFPNTNATNSIMG